jgi:hypothetical protein
MYPGQTGLYLFGVVVVVAVVAVVVLVVTTMTGLLILSTEKLLNLTASEHVRGDSVMHGPFRSIPGPSNQSMLVELQ